MHNFNSQRYPAGLAHPSLHTDPVASLHERRQMSLRNAWSCWHEPTAGTNVRADGWHEPTESASEWEGAWIDLGGEG